MPERSTDSRLVLADGRRLQYTETGPRDGIPVFYCHGAIGTPLGGSLDLEAITSALRVRYIAVSRPGIGTSDPAPGRTVLDFAADLAELADALDLARFSLVGVSAGGPYALAVARELRTRVQRVAVCSSLSPLCAPHRTPGMQPRIRLALGLLARRPRLCAAIGDAVLPLVRSRPELLTRVISAHAASAERGRLHQPDERSAASGSFVDAAAYGVRGMIDDYLTYSGQWGFSPREVAAEVHLWHGGADPLVPLEHALQLAIALPRCRAFFDPDEGHHFLRRRLAEILGVLIGTGEGAAVDVATADLGAGALAVRRRGLR